MYTGFPQIVIAITIHLVPVRYRPNVANELFILGTAPDFHVTWCISLTLDHSKYKRLALSKSSELSASVITAELVYEPLSWRAKVSVVGIFSPC